MDLERFWHRHNLVQRFVDQEADLNAPYLGDGFEDALDDDGLDPW